VVRSTHARLRIYPDGGVARFRVYGDVMPDWETLMRSGEPVDLASAMHGGRAVLANDMFFGHRSNLIMPGRAANMGDGWETRRKRGPGNDWVIVQLGRPGSIERIEVDTNHFKGNFPDRCSIEGTFLPPGVPSEFLTSLAIDWKPVLGMTPLRPHHRHFFGEEILPGGPYTHIRLSIYPDGGVSRLRLFGRPVEGSLEH
jgi:allantoicase